jgi:hypothetical protein
MLIKIIKSQREEPVEPPAEGWKPIGNATARSSTPSDRILRWHGAHIN